MMKKRSFFSKFLACILASFFAVASSTGLPSKGRHKAMRINSNRLCLIIVVLGVSKKSVNLTVPSFGGNLAYPYYYEIS